MAEAHPLHHIPEDDILVPSRESLGFPNDNVMHGNRVGGKLTPQYFIDGLEVLDCKLIGFKGKRPKSHTVLSQGSCFVAHNIVNSPELFRQLAIARHGSGNILVVVYSHREDKFGEIQVDPEGDGDDAGQQQNVSEVLI